MLSAIKFIALAAVASAVELTQGPLTANQAGALELYLNTTSLNNMVNIFVPILSYYILNNKTIEANYESKSFFYDLKLDSVHLNTVQGFTTKLVEMEKDTNIIHVKIGGIDVDAILNGSLKLI